MRILKPGETCPYCGQPIPGSTPKAKLLLLSYIAEGVSLMDVIEAMSEMLELPPQDKTEPEAEKAEPPVPVADAGTEKRAILQWLKDYRTAHGPGCLAAVSAKTAHRKDRRISDDVLRDICAGGAPKLPIEDWRSIAQALDLLAGKETADGNSN